jgi:hypothetical protein
MSKRFAEKFIAAALATAVLTFAAVTRRVLWASRTIGPRSQAHERGKS